MNAPFPLGFPLPTAGYLVLYVATFALHQALMHYVLAGSLYVAGTTILSGSGPTPRHEQPLAAMLRDWLPFLLSAAITAGVAPLLFVQIVYPKNFYTANLLLSWRWLIVIPLLVMAFYLLYVLKSRALARRPAWMHSVVAIVIAASFVFVGFCWTANHLLASREASWPDVYLTGTLPFTAREVALRMAVWIGGAFVTLAMIAGWQLRGRGFEEATMLTSQYRQLGVMAIGGCLVTLVSGSVYLFGLPAETQRLFASSFGLPYVIALLIAAAVLIGAWSIVLRCGALSAPLLLAIVPATVVGLLAAAVLREVVRLAEVDITRLYDLHQQSGEVGGLTVFLIFAVINGGLIVWCVRLVRQALQTAE